ncbi:MAG: hypothetical protein QOE77_2908 [Blastocatellia bacterium]|jgi:hypothetical protein|nr:hypothetical protein [Blastocatellia bacterium]
MPSRKRKTFLQLIVLALVFFGAGFFVPSKFSVAQELRPLPDDATRVYYENAPGKFTALPFEANTTALDSFVVANKDKVTYAEVKGPTAFTVLTDQLPRFYVFVADKMDPPPHQLVRLTRKKDARRFTVVSTKGRKGYSPMDAETVKLEYRLLERVPVRSGPGLITFLNYMELRPRQELTPGEYAIIGDSLLDIAAFRISE